MTRKIDENGIKCPHCGASNSSVVRTACTLDGIRRRRQCQMCGKRFTTREEVLTHVGA